MKDEVLVQVYIYTLIPDKIIVGVVVVVMVLITVTVIIIIITTTLILSIYI